MSGSRTEPCSTLYLPTSVRDRKSTRLNSSHITTSYAVFCLKKKTNVNAHVQPGVSTGNGGNPSLLQFGTAAAFQAERTGIAAGQETLRTERQALIEHHTATR